MSDKNYQKIQELCNKLGDGEALKRLSGVSPSGEHPRLVGEHAERWTDKGATTSQGQSLRVGETKGGVELIGLVEHLREEASGMLGIYQMADDDDDPRIKQNSQQLALTYSHWATLLSELLAEPQPQSVAGDVEECLGCGVKLTPPEIEDNECVLCETKIRHGGDDGSGACLPNVQGQSSATGSAGKQH